MHDIDHYAAFRRATVEYAAQARAIKRDLETLEARIAQRTNGKNAEERKTNLMLALADDTEYHHMRSVLARTEDDHDRAEAECEIAAKRIAAAQWDIRLRIVEALERLGHDRNAGLSAPLVDEALDGMSHGDPESEWYANKPRPRPTYSTDRDDDIPF